LLPKAIAEWIEDRFAPLDKPYHPEDFKNLIISPPLNFKLHRYADWEIFAKSGEVRMEVKLLLTTIQ